MAMAARTQGKTKQSAATPAGASRTAAVPKRKAAKRATAGGAETAKSPRAKSAAQTAATKTVQSKPANKKPASKKPVSAKKAAGKTTKRKTAKPMAVVAPGDMETALQLLSEQNEALRHELEQATQRIAHLEEVNKKVVDRIDWVIDSLQSVLEAK